MRQNKFFNSELETNYSLFQETLKIIQIKRCAKFGYLGKLFDVRMCLQAKNANRFII